MIDRLEALYINLLYDQQTQQTIQEKMNLPGLSTTHQQQHQDGNNMRALFRLLPFFSPPSPFSAGLFLTTFIFRCYDPLGLVFSIHDPTEVAIQKMIDASQEIITMGSQGELGGMSPPMKKHLELEIKILQNAPRDADKLRKLLQVKQRQKEEAMYIADTQRLVTEIEMLKFVLMVVSRREEEKRVKHQ